MFGRWFRMLLSWRDSVSSELGIYGEELEFFRSRIKCFNLWTFRRRELRLRMTHTQGDLPYL